MLKRVFLGGTIDNDYREHLTERLVGAGIEPERIFNPVVKHWNDEAQRREEEQKGDPLVAMIFYLGADKADGSFLSFYSLHEATMGLYDQPMRTAMIFDYEGMMPRAEKSLRKVHKELRKRFPLAPLYESVDDLASWLIPQLK